MNSFIRLNIITNEIKRRYVGIAFWTIGILLYALLMVVFADSIIGEAEGIEAFLNALGDEILALVGTDAEAFTTFEGYFVGEFATITMLMGGIFAGYVGANTIGGEIKNRTLGLVLDKPTSRLSIFLSKFVANTLMFAVSFVILTFLCYFAAEALITKADPSFDYFVDVFIGMFIFVWLFYGIGQTMGAVLSSGKAIAFAAGANIAALMLNFVEAIESVPEEVQFLNPYHYINISEISRSGSLDNLAFFPVVITLLVVAFGAWWFTRRDIHI